MIESDPMPKKKAKPSLQHLKPETRWHLTPADDKRRPGKKLRIRDTETGAVLPLEGALVKPHLGWVKALRCGDVVRKEET